MEEARSEAQPAVPCVLCVFSGFCAHCQCAHTQAQKQEIKAPVPTAREERCLVKESALREGRAAHAVLEDVGVEGDRLERSDGLLLLDRERVVDQRLLPLPAP
eukprot:2085197-Rhodomonas_salina.1